MDERLQVIKRLAFNHFNVRLTDNDANDCLRHIDHLVDSANLPSTTETIILGIKKKLLADVLREKP